MKDWHDMRNDEFEKYLIEVYGDTSWKAYLTSSFSLIISPQP